MDAQPAENDDQTLSRIYSGDDIAAQGLASALHRDDGPSTPSPLTGESKGVTSTRPHGRHVFEHYEFMVVVKVLRGQLVIVGCNVILPIHISIAYLRISLPYLHILKQLPVAYSSTATDHPPFSLTGLPCPRRILRGRSLKRVSGKCRCKLNLFLCDHHVRIRPPQRQQRIHRLDGRKCTLWIDIGCVDDRLQ